MAGYQMVVDGLLDAGVERRTAVVALGGGVVGDLAGFAAATVLRGLPFVQVPTTLLAQVDSSVGGKTGINTRHGKNLLGAFHQPHMVLADTAALSTLPDRELRAGYAEVVKAGLIGDRAFFEWCEANGPALTDGDQDLQAEAVMRACAFKAAVVGDDEREEQASDGRALLNLGHTFGHALEAEVGYGGGTAARRGGGGWPGPGVPLVRPAWPVRRGGRGARGRAPASRGASFGAGHVEPPLLIPPSHRSQ